jgi:hypothetical protein
MHCGVNEILLLITLSPKNKESEKNVRNLGKGIISSVSISMSLPDIRTFKSCTPIYLNQKYLNIIEHIESSKKKFAFKAIKPKHH